MKLEFIVLANGGLKGLIYNILTEKRTDGLQTIGFNHCKFLMNRVFYTIKNWYYLTQMYGFYHIY
jgi:hypothetical protein